MKHLYTSNFRWKVLRNFFLVFTGLFVFFVAGLEFMLWRCDETVVYPKVIERQLRTGELYSPKYFNVNNDYKVAFLNKTPAKIVALGTSRVFQISREDIATPEFFNAGSSASTSKDIDGMLEIIKSLEKENLPDQLILGIDPWLFNPGYPGNRQGRREQLKKFRLVNTLFGVYKFVKNRMMAYSLLINEDQDILPNLISPQRGIGLNAKMFHAGFDVDGSYKYPADSESEPVKSEEEWRQILSKDKYRFPAAETLSPTAIKKFMALLKY